MNITERLFELQDQEYREFQHRITPTIPIENMIGVRLPQLRKVAKEVREAKQSEEFFNELPHKYYDENLLHSILLAYVKDYDRSIREVERFLPYVDNWAVCDTLSPKVFVKNKDRLIAKVREWSASKEVYTCRFGMEILMNHYLKEDFKEEYLEIPAAVHSDEYYVNMMIAWFYATALAFQWDATVKYVEQNRLDVWTHNKTIQKAIESYRITDEQKEYLKSLRRK